MVLGLGYTKKHHEHIICVGIGFCSIIEYMCMRSGYLAGMAGSGTVNTCPRAEGVTAPLECMDTVCMTPEASVSVSILVSVSVYVYVSVSVRYM